MGLFNNLFKGKETEKVQSQKMEQRTIQNMSLSEITEKDGKKIMAEYYDDKADFKQFYDTTRLIIDSMPVQINGALVYSARVSWYGQDDCTYLGDNGEDIGRKSQMTDIKLQIDMEKLYTDPEYQRVLMTDLLEMKRVQRYMQWGLQDNSEQPCGNYIGVVNMNPKKGRYGRAFRTDIGNIVHNSPEMIGRRQQYRVAQERKRQQEMAKKQAQIERLQREMDELE